MRLVKGRSALSTHILSSIGVIVRRLTLFDYYLIFMNGQKLTPKFCMGFTEARIVFLSFSAIHDSNFVRRNILVPMRIS